MRRRVAPRRRDALRTRRDALRTQKSTADHNFIGRPRTPASRRPLRRPLRRLPPTPRRAGISCRNTTGMSAKRHLNVNLSTARWFNGDFNYDGKINVDDYGIIDFNIGIQGPAFSTAGGLDGFAVVPEPASGALMFATAAVCASTARRRRAT